MKIYCPKCGSDEVRFSKRKQILRPFLHLCGIYLFRCEKCSGLFDANIHSLPNAIYAKCPSCHRTDLSRWTKEFYRPDFLTKLMLAFGAKPARCEYCRKNFWSFRLIKERYSKEKRSRRSAAVSGSG